MPTTTSHPLTLAGLSCGLLLLLATCTSAPSKPPLATAADTLAIEPTRHLSLLFAGDLMVHAPQFEAARTADGFDFTDCFAAVSAEIESADVAIANFEVTTAGAPYSGYPMFCCPDEYLTAVSAAGFDILTTANNHCCDRRDKGIVRTIQLMDSLHIPHLGTYTSPDERERQTPYLLEKNGFRIALLNYTYGTNGLPVPKGRAVNLIDRDLMARDIKKAQSLNPDAIIAIMHWGIEYTMRPVKEQTATADWLLQQGVTHVIGGHPHVVEPVEVRTDTVSGRKNVVAYSLGNFISNMTPAAGKPTDGGMMVRLELEKDSVCRLADCTYSLQWVSRPKFSGRKVHRVLPVHYPQDSLTLQERNLLNTYLHTVRPMFERSNLATRETFFTQQQ